MASLYLEYHLPHLRFLKDCCSNSILITIGIPMFTSFITFSTMLTLLVYSITIIIERNY